MNSDYPVYSRFNKDHRYQEEKYRLDMARQQNDYQRTVERTLPPREYPRSLPDGQRLEMERRKKIIKENLYNEQTKKFIDILEKTIEPFSFSVNLKFLKVLKQQFGDSITFTILNLLNSSTKDDFINSLFDSKSEDFTLKSDLKIGLSSYVLLINALNESSLDKKQVNMFIDYIKKSHFEDEWKIIESQLNNKQDDSLVNDNADPFSSNFNSKNELQELITILKTDRKASPLAIKAQFLTDIIKEFFTEIPVNTEFSFLEQGQSVHPQKKIISTFNTLMSKYESVLAEYKINSQFLKEMLPFVKNYLMQEQPRVVAPIFKAFMEQIKTNQDLFNKINTGYRISIDEAFSQHELAKQHNASIKYDTNLMYLLCIEVLARLEKSLTASSEPLSTEEFKAKFKKILEDIAQKFGPKSNMNEVVKSVLDAGSTQLRDVHASLAFVSIIYKLVTVAGFTPSQQSLVFDRIKKIVDTKNITLDQIKAHEAEKKMSAEIINALTSFDSTKTLMPFTVKENNKENKNDRASDLKQSAAKTLQNTIIQGLSGLFGGK